MADLREGAGAPLTEYAPHGFNPTPLNTAAGERNGFIQPTPPAGFTPLHDSLPAPVPPLDTTQTVQAAVEGAPELDETNSIEFMGERFKVAERVGGMALFAFAQASSKGLDSDDMKGLAAMYRMIRGVIHRPLLTDEHGKPQRDDDGSFVFDEREWDRFQEFADAMGADGEELMELVGKAMGVISARPQQRRAVSSTSSPATSPSLKESSSSPATRPDLDMSGMTNVTALGR